MIIGAKTLDQLRDNVAATGLQLSDEELKALDEVSRLPREYPGWMFDRQLADRLAGRRSRRCTVDRADMPRSILAEAQIHPAIRDKIAGNHADIVREVQAAIASNDVVVVGMAQNPFPRRARRTLDAHGIRYRYLEYGNYFGPWRRRTALKM